MTSQFSVLKNAYPPNRSKLDGCPTSLMATEHMGPRSSPRRVLQRIPGGRVRIGIDFNGAFGLTETERHYSTLSTNTRQPVGRRSANVDKSLAKKSLQPFLTRYFSWQPPQSFLPMLPKAALKESKSFTLESAAFASLPSLASFALKSFMFFQISGLAV